jgi:ADP-ribosylation factor related protein 1
MFSLIYGLVEYVLRKDEYHILIIGLDKAGKTNLLEKLKTLLTDHVGMEPSKIMPTVGLNVGRMEAFKSSLIFWDLGGQPGLRSIWDKYYNEAHAVIFVIDSTNRDRLDESKAALDKVLNSRELANAPLLVIANKQDMEAAASMQDISDHLGVQYVQGRPCIVQAASAHTGSGLHDGLKWLIEKVKRSPRRHAIAPQGGRYAGW